jgi:hypothetical protein
MKWATDIRELVWEVSIIAVALAVVTVFFLITTVRLGILPPSVVPMLAVGVAHAQVWDARVGRLHGGGTYGNTWCDSGYWLVDNHLNVGNTNNTLWLTCVTGAW